MKSRVVIRFPDPQVPDTRGSSVDRTVNGSAVAAVSDEEGCGRVPTTTEVQPVPVTVGRCAAGSAAPDPSPADGSPGVVTVATMHKAKGLEWDRVYLLSVNNYDFPSGLAHDTYIAERWFVRDSLNLEAEALAQLETLSNTQYPISDSGYWRLNEGEATKEARLGYVAERLRLLYVGITRAKRDLIITWNTGRRQAQKLQPAVPFIALQDYWQENEQMSK